MKVFLSPTLMGMARECQRCAYDQLILRLKRPRGAFPSLPGGMDEMLKKYTDSYRGKLPPELAHLVGHRLVDDQKLIDTFRQWNGIRVNSDHLVDRPTKNMPTRKISHSLILTGGIDDLLYNEKGEVVVLDFKTKKDEPNDAYGERYYQHTMETYGHMLQEQGFKVSTDAYLWYWWPESVNPDGSIKFGQKTLHMTLDLDATKARLHEIAEMLPAVSVEAMKYRPAPAPECEYCNFVQSRMDNEEHLPSE